MYDEKGQTTELHEKMVKLLLECRRGRLYRRPYHCLRSNYFYEICRIYIERNKGEK